MDLSSFRWSPLAKVSRLINQSRIIQDHSGSLWCTGTLLKCCEILWWLSLLHPDVRQWFGRSYDAKLFGGEFHQRANAKRKHEMRFGN